MIGMDDIFRSRLAVLMERGAHRFDPVRFCYIESLVRRSSGKQRSVCRLIEKKILEALSDFQDHFDKARAKAAKVVTRVSSEYPDSAHQIRKLFEDGDFRGVQRLGGRLDRGDSQKAFAALTNQIAQGGPTLDEHETQLSFNDLLLRQEDEVVQSFGNSLADEGSTERRETLELRSFHLLKESWAKLHYDRLVTRAIEERPENPGPLNAQMLATRSLSAMRKLSPNYLTRFVSYIDTLLWLEQTIDDVKPRIVKS